VSIRDNSLCHFVKTLFIQELPTVTSALTKSQPLFIFKINLILLFISYTIIINVINSFCYSL
jgi:hypothetical protein